MNKWEILAWSIAWEGCISLAQKRKSYTLCVVIGNTEIELLEKMKSIIGIGAIFPTNAKHSKGKPSFNWVIAKIKECYFVLNNIKPFMVSKRKKKIIDLALEYCLLSTTKRKPHHSKRIFKTWKEQVRNKRILEIYNEMKKLNKRGV